MSISHMRLLIFIPFLFFSQSALACQCRGDGVEGKDRFAAYEHIFVAEINKAELIKLDNELFKMPRNTGVLASKVIRGKFIIKETFKGSPSEVKEIYGLELGHSCAKPLLVGGKYLVYTNSNRVYLSVCSPSRWIDPLQSIEQAMEDRRDLEWLRLKKINDEKAL